LPTLGCLGGRNTFIMEKKPGKQNFLRYNNLNHVFKSDKLKIVKGTGVKYEKGFNGNNEDNNLVISKYTKLNHLEKSVRNSSFYFNNALEWLDPFELLFYRPNVTIDGQENVSIFASCFACNDIDNEEGVWQIWSKGEKEPIVRVTYNVNKLLSTLNDHADNLYNYYLAGMEYKSRESILKEKCENQQFTSIDDYLNKLCLKRNAYKYENELRLFVKTESNINNIDSHIVINNISYNNGVITEITLPPAEPFGNNNPAKDKMKEYQECLNSLTKQRIESLIKDGLLNCKINQSALYCINIKKRTYTF